MILSLTLMSPTAISVTIVHAYMLYVLLTSLSVL